jgi:hypothetical protein
MFYGILDILAVSVFGFYHVWALRSILYEHFMRSSGKVSMGYAAAGAAVGTARAGEKRRTSTASYAPFTGTGGHSASTGPTTGGAVVHTLGPAGGAPGATGGPLNGRGGLAHRNSNSGVAESRL